MAAHNILASLGQLFKDYENVPNATAKNTMFDRLKL